MKFTNPKRFAEVLRKASEQIDLGHSEIAKTLLDQLAYKAECEDRRNNRLAEEHYEAIRNGNPFHNLTIMEWEFGYDYDDFCMSFAEVNTTWSGDFRTIMDRKAGLVGGLIFHGAPADGYKENGSVLLNPCYGWSSHT